MCVTRQGNLDESTWKKKRGGWVKKKAPSRYLLELTCRGRSGTCSKPDNRLTIQIKAPSKALAIREARGPSADLG